MFIFILWGPQISTNISGKFVIGTPVAFAMGGAPTAANPAGPEGQARAHGCVGVERWGVPPGSTSSGQNVETCYIPEQAASMGTYEWFTTGAFLITLGGLFLYYGGVLLNGSIEFFVINMTTLIRGPIGDSIVQSWTIIRDIINLTFVFGLIYVAFMTIMKADTHQLKHAVVKIMIGAVLINFSLYFAKVIIDVSNVTSLEIYKSISSIEGNSGSGVGTSDNLKLTNIGISGFFAERLGVLSLYDPKAVTAANIFHCLSPRATGAETSRPARIR